MKPDFSEVHQKKKDQFAQVTARGTTKVYKKMFPV